MTKKIIQLTQKNDFTIIVSLPKNDIALARVADTCGADAIKIHTNVEHKASQTVFGSWTQEKSIIQDIKNAISCPLGLMPGSTTVASPEDLKDAAKLGIDFIDIYDFDMPVWMLSVSLAKMIALGHGYQLSTVPSLEKIGADAIEASIIPFSEYRQPLTVKDIEAYQVIVEKTSLPVFVPSQKKLEPQDLKKLKSIGVKGVILGTIAIGDTPESFKKNLPNFIKSSQNQ